MGKWGRQTHKARSGDIKSKKYGSHHTTTPFTSPRLSLIKTLPPFPPLNLLQVACHLFQAGCNMVKLGIMKKENIAGDIGSLGIF